MTQRAYTAHLKRWDEDYSLLAAKQVEELIHHPGWNHLTRLLDEAHGAAFDKVLGLHTGDTDVAKILEHAEYTRLIGFLAGLKQVTFAAKAFAEHAESVRRRNSTS